MNADLKAAAQQAFNLLDRLPINEGYHDETVEVLDALRAGLAAQAPAEGDALALALEQGMRDLAACAIEAETGREATSEWIDAAIKLAKPGTPLGRMRDALTAHRAAAAAAIGAPRLTEQEKTVIVRNWFADDWAIESALGMLHDYDLAVKRSKPQPKGTAASVPEWKREARQAAEGKQAYYRDMMRQAREAREDAQAPAPVAGLVRRGFLLQWPTANGRRPVWSDTDAAAKAIGCPVEALFALDAQAPAVGADWQPIETAPQDGTKVLVWFSALFDGMVDVARWNDDKFAKKPRPYWSGRGERIYGVLAYRQGKPTHWMPLPAAPVFDVPVQPMGGE